MAPLPPPNPVHPSTPPVQDLFLFKSKNDLAYNNKPQQRLFDAMDPWDLVSGIFLLSSNQLINIFTSDYISTREPGLIWTQPNLNQTLFHFK